MFVIVAMPGAEQLATCVSLVDSEISAREDVSLVRY